MPSLTTQILNSHNVENFVRDTLTIIKNRMIANMARRGRNASMRSVNSLKITTTGIGGTLEGLRSFVAMETGRRGGKIPQGLRHIIAQWIDDKGISIYDPYGGKPNKKKVAFLIARSIQQKGTALKRRGGFDDIYSSVINEEVLKLADKIRFTAGSDIDSINRKYASLS